MILLLQFTWYFTRFSFFDVTDSRVLRLQAIRDWAYGHHTKVVPREQAVAILLGKGYSGEVRFVHLLSFGVNREH